MIIGLTGSLCAGKGIVSDFLKEKGFVYLSLSDELREIAKESKIQLTRKNLQDLGNKLREEKGFGFLAEKVVNKIKSQEYKRAIVDGIRNPAEIDFLEKMNNFSLVSVDAPREERFERMIKRDRESDPKIFEEFVSVDNRDQGFGESEGGQAVGECMRRAKFTLMNFGTLEEVNSKVGRLFDEIERKIPRLDWEEYFIEISRSVAKRSTCNRGRSGCVIVKNKQIIVTGYVGSPKGLPHCDEVGHQFKRTIHEDGSISEHCVRTTHAEQNAMCQAAKLGVSIEGATLYCKMTPCIVCAKMIINVGIKEIVCEKKYHVGKDSEEMFEKAGINLKILDDEIEEYSNQEKPLLSNTGILEKDKVEDISTPLKKEDQRILVIDKNILFGFNEHYFEGFKEHHEHDYETKILSNFKVMRRGGTHESEDHPEGNAEKNYNHKQPIGYALIVNKERKEVFAYQRATKNEHYGETRLQGKWSWGVGGHIEDFEAEAENPVKESLLREIKEEIQILGNIKDIKVLGYINDDADDVGKVHFGILYIVEVDGNVTPKDPEMSQGKLIHIDELNLICSSPKHEVEEWSRIALEPLIRYFED